MTTPKKIPCSVSLLTLNSARGLPSCLESLKDFAEIIVCDGNSTDGTQDMARARGARVLRQYDTDEPNTPCVMDKAAVRERAMRESTLPWRFFMDSDDGLSREAVEEIRAIVTDSRPKHLIWRMPTRIFLGGETLADAREIKHEATYPAYQTRLVHERVGAHFRGAVHDRLAFDANKFPVGTMRSVYNFHWPQERVNNYWRYIGTYARRELQTSEYKNFSQLLYWGIYRRARTILGYVFWRLPSMYLRYGFKDSMPLSIELKIVRYHCLLLFGGIALYFKTREWYVLLVETLKGKDFNRILGNLAARKWEAYGRVLNVGRDGKSSYWRFIKHCRWHRVVTADIDPKAKPDVVVHLDTDELPFEDGYFDTAIMCNVLEHVAGPGAVLAKVHRVLSPGGAVYGIVPFLVGVHPNPNDYARYTEQGLRQLLHEAGFFSITITPLGRGPFAASYYQSEFVWPRVVKLLVLPAALLLDKIVLTMRPSFRQKFPLSYAFEAKK